MENPSWDMERDMLPKITAYLPRRDTSTAGSVDSIPVPVGAAKATFLWHEDRNIYICDPFFPEHVANRHASRGQGHPRKVLGDTGSPDRRPYGLQDQDRQCVRGAWGRHHHDASGRSEGRR